MVIAFPVGFLFLGFSQGIWNPLAIYLVRSLVSVVPESGKSVEFRDFEKFAKGGLVHSALYCDKDACGKITRWVKDQLETRDNTQQTG